MMLARLQCCTACGRPLPPTSRFGIAMERGYAEILDMLLAAGDNGVRSDTMFNQVYGTWDGGPLSGRKALWVRVHYLNKLLWFKGKRVKNVRRGTGEPGTYYLVDL